MSEDQKPPADEPSEQAPAQTEVDPSAEASAEPAEASAAEPAKASAEEPAAAEPKTSVQESPSAEEEDVPLDAAGRERPRFLLGFPPHPDLARLSAAFEAGNYALVRAEAEALAERTESPAVRDAALELRRRIEPDPLAKYMLALTAALLLLLAYWAYHH